MKLHHRVENILSTLWWKYIPGTVIEVKWPVGWVILYWDDVSTESADPNDHYRPYLEKYVGRQHWDWRLGNAVADNKAGTKGYDTLRIKFRKGKEDYAIIAKLKWM